MITAEEARKISAAHSIKEALEYIDLEIKSAATNGDYEAYLYDSVFIDESTPLFAEIKTTLIDAGYAIRQGQTFKGDPKSKYLCISWEQRSE